MVIVYQDTLSAADLAHDCVNLITFNNNTDNASEFLAEGTITVRCHKATRFKQGSVKMGQRLQASG
jgi:spore coat protein U-like protein|tara:strand:- start:18690 stop:18887 length:198 start_codon:yes stop_codon:yes gene_type:complete